jgi:hypothetical protein
MALSEEQVIESVFAGGGDMGARMRAFDWSTTDLGPVPQWPQSLRAGVRIVLAAGHPMLISWRQARIEADEVHRCDQREGVRGCHLVLLDCHVLGSIAFVQHPDDAASVPIAQPSLMANRL